MSFWPEDAPLIDPRPASICQEGPPLGSMKGDLDSISAVRYIRRFCAKTGERKSNPRTFILREFSRAVHQVEPDGLLSSGEKRTIAVNMQLP